MGTLFFLFDFFPLCWFLILEYIDVGVLLSFWDFFHLLGLLELCSLVSGGGWERVVEKKVIGDPERDERQETQHDAWDRS